MREPPGVTIDEGREQSGQHDKTLQDEAAHGDGGIEGPKRAESRPAQVKNDRDEGTRPHHARPPIQAGQGQKAGQATHGKEVKNVDGVAVRCLDIGQVGARARAQGERAERHGPADQGVGEHQNGKPAHDLAQVQMVRAIAVKDRRSGGGG